MTGAEDLFLYWPGRHILRPGKQFQQIYQPGKPPGRISPGQSVLVLIYPLSIGLMLRIKFVCFFNFLALRFPKFVN